MKSRRVQLYAAGYPKEGQWVVLWQNGYMPSPSFFYYDTKEEAEESLNRFVEDGYEWHEFVKVSPPVVS